jgi:hypothetical protein
MMLKIYCKADLENLCSWEFKEGEMENILLEGNSWNDEFITCIQFSMLKSMLPRANFARRSHLELALGMAESTLGSMLSTTQKSRGKALPLYMGRS